MSTSLLFAVVGINDAAFFGNFGVEVVLIGAVFLRMSFSNASYALENSASFCFEMFLSSAPTTMQLTLCFSRISRMVQQANPIIVIDDVRQLSDCLVEVLEAVDLLRVDANNQEQLLEIKYYCLDLQNIIEEAILEIIDNSSFATSQGFIYRTNDIASIEFILYTMSIAFNKLSFVISTIDLLMDVYDRYSTSQ